MTQEMCDALSGWAESDLFSKVDRALLAYVDAMAKDMVVSDDTFASLKEHFSNRQIVELTLMVGAYISHAHVLQALEVDLEPNENAGV